MNAQISFIEGQYSLIHIPLELYPILLQPILRILLPNHDGVPSTNHSASTPPSSTTTTTTPAFLNISITPLECSIVCPTSHAHTLFPPLLAHLPAALSSTVSISRDSYIVFSVSSAGMEAGQRVMDLTAPLAMAGIPIFFITTYYTDFILVPAKDRATVGQALLERGFVFSENEAAYVAPVGNHSRAPSAADAGGIGAIVPPGTPPPSNVKELQARTFALLKKRAVVPFVEKDLFLVQCSGKEVGLFSNQDDNYSRGSNGSGSNGNGGGEGWLDKLDSKLYVGLIAALASQPRFLSFTLAADDAPSLLIDKALLYLFGDSIAGDTEGDLVAIFLDLAGLPLESTGIVCGVAGRLVEEMRVLGGSEGEVGIEGGNELSYLSTARAGAVVLSKEGSRVAMEALKPLLEGE